MSNYQFIVEVNQHTIQTTGYFHVCYVMPYRLGRIHYQQQTKWGNVPIQQIPVQIMAGKLSLKHGLALETTFWDWRESIIRGFVAQTRMPLAVMMIDENYDTIANWNFMGAWPSKVSSPAFNQNREGFIIHEMSVEFEQMIRNF
ncbi:MAG: hypothetical protein B6242_03315 [Anaerolineaceae bacterium 4572_78]|nr:MAG: hypothetical protein B6242_03315 [Anaerolineaceae bacterium 4572_78]